MAHKSVASRKNTSFKSGDELKMAAAQNIKSSSGSRSAGGGVDRQQMITVAAYYLAEQRGFSGGDPVADWLAAEARIDAMLNNAKGAVIH